MESLKYLSESAPLAESANSPEGLAEIREALRGRLRRAYETGRAGEMLGNPSEMVYPRFPDHSQEQQELIYAHPEAFLEEMIDMVKSCRGQDDKEKMTAFLGEMREGFFSGSPDVTSGLHTDDLMVISARVSRVEEMRGWIGQSLTPSLVYALSYSRYTPEHLIAKIDSLEPGERIDVVHQLETVCSSAFASGDWADPAAQKAEAAIAHYAAAENPLMRIVAEEGLRRIRDEFDNPSLSFIQFQGDSKDGRLNSMDATKSLSDKCLSDLPMGYKMVAPAGDVVLGVDMAGMPRYAAEANASELRSLEDVGTRRLQSILDINGCGLARVTPRRFVNSLGNSIQFLMPGASAPELYARLFDMSVEEADGLIKRAENIVPRLHADWEGIRDRAVEMAGKAMRELEADPKVPKIRFIQFEDALAADTITPFAGLSEDDLIMLAECLRPEIYSRVESELGTSIKDMPFRSLVHMLRFLSSEKSDALEALKDSLHAMPGISEKILKAFFAASESAEFGRTVLNICKNRNEAEADMVFSKYIELAESAARISVEMLHADEDHEKRNLDGREIVRSAQRNLLVRARKVMDEFSSEKVSAEEMSLRLQSVTADNALFGSVIRALRGKGVRMEDIEGLRMETVRGGEISSDQQGEMLAAFKVNRLESDDPKVLAAESEASFRRSLADPASEFKVLFFGNSPVVFLRFEPISHESAYVGSFNVSPELKGEKVAGAFLASALAEKNAGFELIGEVWEKRPLSMYLRAGFEQAGPIENWHGTGESFQRLVIPKGKLG